MVVVLALLHHTSPLPWDHLAHLLSTWSLPANPSPRGEGSVLSLGDRSPRGEGVIPSLGDLFTSESGAFLREGQQEVEEEEAQDQQEVTLEVTQAQNSLVRVVEVISATLRRAYSLLLTRLQSLVFPGSRRQPGNVTLSPQE